MRCHHWRWVFSPPVRSGHQVRFFLDDKAEAIPENLEADLVALSVETFTARRAYQIADGFRLRRHSGRHGRLSPDLPAREALLHADAVVTGDAEGVWEQLLEDMSSGRLQRIYRSDNRATLADMRIDRTIFAGKRYAPIELAQYTLSRLPLLYVILFDQRVLRHAGQNATGRTVSR